MAVFGCDSCGRIYEGEDERPCPACGRARGAPADVLEAPSELGRGVDGLAAGAGSGPLAHSLAPDEEHGEVAAPAVTIASSGETRECPACAETIKARAKVCRFCGLDLVRPRDAERPVARARHASASRLPQPSRGPEPALVAALSFLFTGLGQAYMGSVGRAAMWWLVGVSVVALGATFADWMFATLAGLTVWWLNVVDAYLYASAGRSRSRSRVVRVL